jgi:hypothetical protein
MCCFAGSRSVAAPFLFTAQRYDYFALQGFFALHGFFAAQGFFAFFAEQGFAFSAFVGLQTA